MRRMWKRRGGATSRGVGGRVIESGPERSDGPESRAHGSLVNYVSISRTLERFAMAESEARAPDETGGILIGRIRDDTLVLTHVTGPGPNAIHRPTLFMRDGHHAQRALEDAAGKSGGAENYVGEWHSHPFPQGPSTQDVESMERIGRKPSYACAHPVLLLCRRERARRRAWKLFAFQWNGHTLLPRRLRIAE
jgi:integrative and conjugative element protein (TIGR02256 family)